ncbi:MAG TPA: FeoA family protein, partial [Anaerolineales bacterium]|nr:FeoA family protein [Anaerolineales bacterium]
DSATLTLSQLRPPQQAIVQRVRDADPQLLRYLSEMGLKPEAHVKILDYSPFDDNLHLKIEGNEEAVVLGPSVTSQVYVELTE